MQYTPTITSNILHLCLLSLLFWAISDLTCSPKKKLDTSLTRAVFYKLRWFSYHLTTSVAALKES